MTAELAETDDGRLARLGPRSVVAVPVEDFVDAPFGAALGLPWDVPAWPFA